MDRAVAVVELDRDGEGEFKGEYKGKGVGEGQDDGDRAGCAQLGALLKSAIWLD
jgi:hypothetical protein